MLGLATTVSVRERRWSFFAKPLLEAEQLTFRQLNKPRRLPGRAPPFYDH